MLKVAKDEFHPTDPDRVRYRLRHFVEGACHLAAMGSVEWLDFLGTEAFCRACLGAGVDETEARVEVLRELAARGDREAAQRVLDVLGGADVRPGDAARLYAEAVAGVLSDEEIGRDCRSSRQWAWQIRRKRAA